MKRRTFTAGVAATLAAPLVRAQALPAGQRIGESPRHASHLLARFVGKLQAEAVDSRGQPLLQVPAGLLRLSAEDRIAATYIRHHRMSAAAFIA